MFICEKNESFLIKRISKYILEYLPLLENLMFDVNDISEAISSLIRLFQASNTSNSVSIHSISIYRRNL